ncbi:MAG: EAL domain-containing protein [Actinomycetota bacterium]
MTEMRGIGSPQQALWTIGSSLIDAGPGDAEDRLEAVLGEVCALVGAAAGGVFEHDTAAKTNRAIVAHGVSQDTMVPARPGAARVGLAEGGGHALLGLEEIFGDDYRDELGWPDGQAIVSLIDESDESVVTLVIVAFEPDWGDAELELLRGFGLLVRQFMRRMAAEGTLRQRRGLDEVALGIADQLQGLTGVEFDDAIESLLRQVMEAVDGHACFLVDVVDERHFDLPVLVTKGMSLPPLGSLAIDDINAFTGADAADMLDLLRTTRILDATELTGALLGEESDAYGAAVVIPRSVVLVPAEVAGFAATAIGVSRASVRPWTSTEIDAVSTIVSMLTQTRARCAAEVDSQARFALQQVLTDVGQRFLNVDAGEALRAADLAFRDVAESLGAAFAIAIDELGDDDTIHLARSWVGAEAHGSAELTLADLGLTREQLASESHVGVIRLSPELVDRWELPGDEWRIASGKATLGNGSLALGFPLDSPLPATVGPEAVGGFIDLASQLQLRVAAESETRRRLRAEEVLSDIADDFLGGSSRNAVQVESRALERLAGLLDLRGTVIGTAPPVPVIERMWRHPDLGDGGPVIGTAVPTGAIPFDELDPNAPVELTAEGDSLTATSLRERWEGANLLIAPVTVDGEMVAAMSAIRHGFFDDRDRSVLRSVAGMLGQFRARVAAEHRDEVRLQTEQLLSDFAAELADATSETLRESVNAAFMNICEAMDLTCFTIWRIDTDLEAYRPVHRAETGSDCDVLPEPRPFGTDAMLDEARTTDGWVIGPDRATDDPTLNVVAFRRGSEPRESILITKSRREAQWSPETLDLFREVSGVLRDVEARIAAERYVDAAFDNAPVGIVLRDDRLRLITCNVAFTDFLGYPSPAELAGTMPDHVYAEGLEAIEWIDRGGRLESEGAFRRKDGGRVWGHMRATVVEGDAGDHFWLIHVEDITDRRRAEALLRFQATHDELTGLANRGRLIQELDELAAAPEGVAVLLLDLDRFKNINDSLGHDRGDELLVTIADRLRLAVRPGDLVARLGGDEFAVTLAGPVTPTDAEFVANRLLRLIGEPVTLGAQKLYPSASIGIAFSDSEDVADLLRRADTAMYRAKAQGRAQAALFDEALQLEVTERMATEAGLRGALRNSEFLVYYQPEVSTDDGRMLGAEALIRWNHPSQGVLAAGSFIEVAEETGLVVEMGELVLGEAVAQAATWPGGDDGPMVRVNLAAAQLQRDDTVALVRFALQESGLAPHRLCLEITESAVMTDIRRSEQILHRLKELGVKLAVDDFGTGFSSLAYLKRFPVDALKIDRAFVVGLGEDDEDRTFVSSIISLADALGLDVVAEGVETEVQAEILSELGCRRAQGYLYARPGPPGDLAPFLPGHQDA